MEKRNIRVAEMKGMCMRMMCCRGMCCSMCCCYG